ncbi:site-specific integrase [Sutcliffiella horikoshii]|uniref:Site-specific integrase n=1 Tax=Sutcliffiella horikoshii TaxID=79883 RepID=A0ABN4Z8Y4_9BACI|nr:tyrosine-type recombinase/integrase [Sutcliffiella horikoshii]ART74835.1 site-specific integrase [Sutcliffiella horikoshii]
MKGKVYKPKCKCPKDKKKKCRCKGNWGYLVDIGNHPKTGKRRQRGKFTFKTKKEAEDALVKFLNEIHQGSYIIETDITFEDYSKQFILEYEATGKVSPGTVRIREKDINRLLDFLAKIKLKKITEKQFQSSLDGLKERGYAENTLKSIHVTGRMIFKKAFKNGFIKKDPSVDSYVPVIQKTVEELEKEKETFKYLEKEELALFLATAEKKGIGFDHTAFVTLSYTGIRNGELCALKWKDIDFQKGTIRINKTYKNDTNNIKKYKLGPPKTKKARRTIVVDDYTLDVLSKHKVLQNKIKLRHGNSYYDKGFVFAEESKEYAGYPTYPKKVENRMERLLKMIDLNLQLTPHSLRHTHTSLLAELGVELIDIMDRLGHSKCDTTKNIYLHVTKPKKKETANKFSELMQGLR